MSMEHCRGQGHVDGTSPWFRPGRPRLRALRILVGRGDIPKDSTVTDLQFGWEICSTRNVPLGFNVDGYSVSTGLK